MSDTSQGESSILSVEIINDGEASNSTLVSNNDDASELEGSSKAKKSKLEKAQSSKRSKSLKSLPEEEQDQVLKQRYASKIRMESVTQRIPTVKKKVQEILKIPGVSAYFKATFKTVSNVDLSWECGTPFDSSPQVVEPLSSYELKTTISESIKEAAPILASEIAARTSLSQPLTAISLSPTKRNLTAGNTELCEICSKKEVLVDIFIFDSEWIMCEGEGESCDKGVHADCLGFPGVTTEGILNLPKWFCKKHRSFGRLAAKVGYKAVNCPTSS